MSQHLDDLVNVPDTRELELARRDLDMLNQRYTEIAKEAGWLAASSVPVVGGVVDVASAIGNAWTGNWADAGLDLVGLIPVWGDGAKAAAKGTKIARYAEKLMSQVAAAQRKVKALEDHVRKSAAASKYWASKRGEAYRKLQEDLRKCNTKACRQKKIDEYKDGGKYKNIPREKGTWAGEPGNSKWSPEPGSNADKALKEYGQDGISYKNGKPDFSPFVKKGPDGQPIQTRISDMKGDLARGPDGDVGQAVGPLKERYGSWSKAADENGFTWHHNEDTSTMQLVDSRIHNTGQGGGAHSGGASAVNDPSY
ncbi:HNH endonuclease [Agrobacterium leguminum]|uniref:HNH endonuclease n=1 Tax=Agrobacterium TaxID=357 RepID=UPI00115EA439|nr:MULTISPECIES: HNH endonuclease [Agrobacterium]WLD98974.1 HNH endonuclease [Agrobacterium leguminum]